MTIIYLQLENQTLGTPGFPWDQLPYGTTLVNGGAPDLYYYNANIGGTIWTHDPFTNPVPTGSVCDSRELVIGNGLS